ncbi:anaerobic ribonucleoside-triphosphate reductase activating protein [Georgenia sp. SYP-B2076]|uniref:anaerobic ribonucleoside-triphosphate reductase activating protein n=1 Tax=Georgenia sp. SYP-B2076 TaxID=2495881 RepID=UPI00197AF65A|nr:anaerobic ribonucleoside-triphosphate reductase activating protein [Georgenia sp. SYP-B2076]
MSRLSTVDWPGRLAATLFLQGCPWDCSYCHNPSLIPARTPGEIGWADVLAFLRRRRGLLDGVVFSGGEATRQAALAPAIADVRELGFAVGLHSAGPYPARLARVLPLVDWVGLDIKALPEDYPEVVRRGASGPRAWESLDLVLARGVDHEIRTTVYPGSAAAGGALEIARRVRARGARAFALQQARPQGTREGFVAAAAGWDAAAWDAECAAMAAEMEHLGFERFTYRAG